jgi:cardiolipin-specific phospholipase
MLIRLARQWWTQSNPQALHDSQNKLFASMIKTHWKMTPLMSSSGMNALHFSKNNEAFPLQQEEMNSSSVCVLTHGFGSGLGFFYGSVDPILRSGKFRSVVLVDWLGMGGSIRPPCHQRPYRSLLQGKGFCEAHFITTEQSVNFFIDPFDDFLEQYGWNKDVCLVGHSLGGYLTARYALKYPSRISKLVLASPVGIPSKPFNKIPSSMLPTTFRLLDALWSANFTPQSIVRLQGASRGRRSVYQAIRGRIPELSNELASLLADYLFHVTVAEPSGEYAMNSLLEPAVSPEVVGVYAREPLEEQISRDLDDNIELRISFGDHDWMRTNESSARKVIAALGPKRARLDIINQAGHHLYIENIDEFVATILT